MLNLYQVSSYAWFFSFAPLSSRDDIPPGAEPGENTCRCLSCRERAFRCVSRQRLFEGLIPNPWLTTAMCAPVSCRNRHSKDISSTRSSPQLPLSWWKPAHSLQLYQLVRQNVITSPTVLFSCKSFDHYARNILTVTTDPAALELFLIKGRWFVFFICSLLDLWTRAAVGSVAGGRGIARDSPICYKYNVPPKCYKLGHFFITAFLTSNKSSRSEAGCVQWDSLRFLSLFSYFQNQRSFLAVIFSVCGLSFWARTACIWELQRKPGQGHHSCGSDP